MQTTETRAQHLEWCKQRAYQYCDAGDVKEAAVSFMSDMSKHEETRSHAALSLMLQMMMGGMLKSSQEMKSS